MPLHRFKQLQNQNIILLPGINEQFNIKQFTPKWLNENNILPLSEIDSDSLFSPNVVQAKSKKLSLTTLPNQIQINPTFNSEMKIEIPRIFSSIIDNLEIESFGGIGINFHYSITSNDESMHEISRKYLFHKEGPFSDFFNDSSALYGTYLSKQINENVRLKLDIKPALLIGTKQECISFSFNFHSDLASKNPKEEAKEIVSNISEWDSITNYIIDLLK